MKTIFIIAFFILAFASAEADSNVVWTWYTHDFWKDDIWEAKVSPDGRFVAFTDEDIYDSIAVRILNISDGSTYKNLIADDTNSTFYFAWVNDSIIASDYYYNDIYKSRNNNLALKVWNIYNDSCLYTFTDSSLGFTGRWKSRYIHCVDSFLFVVYRNGETYLDTLYQKRYKLYPFDSMLVFNTTTWQISRRFRSETEFIKPSPAGNYYLNRLWISTGNGFVNYLDFMDIVEDTLIWRFYPPDNVVETGKYLAISPNGQYVVYSPGDTNIRIIDYQNRSYSDTKLNWNNRYSSIICYSPENDRYLITGDAEDYNTEFGMFSITSGNKIFSFFDSTTAGGGMESVKDSNYFLVYSNKEIRLFRIDWTVTSIINNDDDEDRSSFIYPNPSSDYIEIVDVVGDVKIFDVLGIEHPATAWHPTTEGNVRIDVSGLPKGVYFVSVGGAMYKFVKM